MIKLKDSTCPTAKAIQVEPSHFDLNVPHMPGHRRNRQYSAKSTKMFSQMLNTAPVSHVANNLGQTHKPLFIYLIYMKWKIKQKKLPLAHCKYLILLCLTVKIYHAETPHPILSTSRSSCAAVKHNPRVLCTEWPTHYGTDVNNQISVCLVVLQASRAIQCKIILKHQASAD